MTIIRHIGSRTGLILLVEDNNDDEDLTIRALKKNNVANQIVVVRDGVEALDFLFATGAHAGRDRETRPQVMLLDRNLPKLSGFDVLRRVCADEHTRLLPIVILTSSKEDEDVIQSYALGANSYVRKPVDFKQFTEPVKCWVSTGFSSTSRRHVYPSTAPQRF